MKKLLALIVAAALSLSLVACGGGGGAGDNDTPSTGNGDTTSADTPSGGDSKSDQNNTSTGDLPELQLNETITTEYFDFTLTDVTFVEATSLPIGSYTLDDDKVFLVCDYSLDYIGKENNPIGPIAKMQVLYGDGYTFDDYNEVILTLDSDGHIKEEELTLTNKGQRSPVSFEPLSDNTYLGCGYLAVPVKVKDDTEGNLSIKISIVSDYFQNRHDTEYLYIVR